KAVTVRGQPMFLIQDPKDTAVHEIKSLDEMRDLLASPGWFRSSMAKRENQMDQVVLYVDTLDPDHRARLEQLDDRVNGSL
ncbi:MAG: hypothetical protein AAF637_11960, partial [Pseudomonadota bacterium]